jgi:hypothetical protein
MSDTKTPAHRVVTPMAPTGDAANSTRTVSCPTSEHGYVAPVSEHDAPLSRADIARGAVSHDDAP